MHSTSTRNLERSHGGNGLPKGALYGAFGLVLLTLVLVFADQAMDAMRGEQTTTSPEVALRLSFETSADGDVTVFSAGEDDQRALTTLAADDSSFLRSVVGALLNKRERADIPADLPFDLIRWSDGTMILADPANGQYMPLNGFGRDNEAAFRRLFAAASAGS